MSMVLVYWLFSEDTRFSTFSHTGKRSISFQKVLASQAYLAHSDITTKRSPRVVYAINDIGS